MKGMLRLAVCVSLAAAPPTVTAALNSQPGATTLGDFLNLGAGARAFGMGEAFVAVADDATSLYWNPAALTRIKNHDVAAMHAPHYAGSYFDYGAYGKNLGDWGAYGLGLQYFSAGAITQTENGQNVGTVHPYDMAVSAGYAHEFEHVGLDILDGFALGLSLKYIRAALLTTASAKALDWGVLSAPYLDGKLRLAASMSNIGSRIKFDQEAESLPIMTRLGGAYAIDKNWVVSADVNIARRSASYGSIGTEFAYPVAGAWRMAMRGGFNSQTAGNGDGASGLALGIGLGNGRLVFDYGLAPLATLGFSHRVSLGFKWGDVPRREFERNNRARRSLRI
ncbi:MAG: PorV/PorQ family protein [Elusimicrobiota bacterium]